MADLRVEVAGVSFENPVIPASGAFGFGHEYEKLYPGYFLAEAGAFHNDVNGGRYIVARFYRRDGKFIKPQRKTKTNRRRKE